MNQGLTTPFQFIPERVGLPATDWAIFADQKINPEAGLVLNAVWTAAGGGTFQWSTPSNWQGGVVPGVADDAALFGTAVGSGVATVLLDADRHMSSLTFSPASGGGYVLSGSGGYSLYLASGGNPASISVTSGSNAINAPVVVGDRLNVAAAVGTSLTIFGPISESGGSHALTLSGGGSVTLSGTNTYTGGTAVSGGTMIVTSASALPDGGSLTVGSSLLFNALLVPTSSAVVTAMPMTAGSTESAGAASAATSGCTTVTTVAPSSAGPASSCKVLSSTVQWWFQSARPSDPGPIPRGQRSNSSSPRAELLVTGQRSAGVPWQTRRIAADLAWLDQAANDADDSDQECTRNVTLPALDAVFAEYGR